ncbi:MAG: hypothetical protein H7039_11120 [Bryobacteraceae bacterium]|nr:hypothetical protein [Bryobacteraceae bacterium]
MPDFNTTIFTTTERIYMVDFARARTGSAHRRFPDVDNAGYRDDAFATEHGPIMSAMVGQTRVTVRLFRTEISPNARLFVVSSNPAIVEITSPVGNRQLRVARSHDIEFSALAAGRVKLEVRYNFVDGPIIGELYVQVYPRIQIPMVVHLLTVNGRNQPANFFSRACANRAARVARVTEFVNLANEGWIPHGVIFVITAFVDTVWGVAEIPSGSNSPGLIETLTAGMNSPNRSAVAVNVFIVPSIAATVTGIGVSTASARAFGLVTPAAPPPPPAVQRFGSGLFLHSASVATPQTIEHEMGHYMSLCGLPNQGHSSGDLNVPAGTHTRDDLVTRRRLMYPIVSLPNAAPSTWRNNTGYGNQKAGSFITYRRLPAAQDFTFEESNRARLATLVPQFFAP